MLARLDCLHLACGVFVDTPEAFPGSSKQFREIKTILTNKRPYIGGIGKTISRCGKLECDRKTLTKLVDDVIRINASLNCKRLAFWMLMD